MMGPRLPLQSQMLEGSHQSIACRPGSTRLAVAAAIRWMAIAIAVWTPVQNSLTRAYPVLPGELVWLDEVFVLAILVLWLFWLASPERFARRATSTDLLLAAFVLTGALSTVLNHVSPLRAVMGYRSLLQYVVVYYALASIPTSTTFTSRFLGAVVGLAMLQVPVTVVQAVATKASGLSLDDDFIVGTFNFNQANSLSYYVACVACLLLGLLRYEPRRSRWAGWRLGLLALPFLFGSSRAMVWLFPFVMAWIYRDDLGRVWRSRRSLRRLAPLAVGIGLVCAGASVYASSGSATSRLAARRLLADSLTVNPWGNGGRLQHVAYTYRALRQEPWGLWLGIGPGTYTSSTGYFLGSSAVQAMTDHFGYEVHGPQYYPGMIVSLPGYAPEPFRLRDFSQLTSTFGEWGLLGFVSLALAIATVIRHAARLERRSSAPPRLRAFSRSVQGIGVIVLLAVPILPSWEEQAIGFLWWGMAGVMTGYGRTVARDGP